MRSLSKPHPFAMFCAWFLTVSFVLFPKGGWKVGFIPLTWNYLFLAVSTPPIFLVRMLALPLRLPMRLWAVIAMLLPFQILFVYAWLSFPISNFGFFSSFFMALFPLPLCFLLVYPPFFPYIDGGRLSRYLRFCILGAALWGIFLFVWHPLTGHYIEIPYLTVNADDVGTLETTKHISRGFFLKLISTYNNGNLYGVCTLMLVPMYDLMEKKRWRRLAVKLALLLTLSRTVWAGMVVAEALSIGVLLFRQLATFPKLYLGKATKRVGALILTVVLVFASLLFNSNNLTFLFDPKLGGRAGFLPIFLNSPFLPIGPPNAIQEVAYVSAAQQFGFTGFGAFTLLMLSPVILLLVDISALQSPFRRAALKGLIIYSFLAGIDAGFNFIPTMAFYWFVYMIYLFGWPAGHTKKPRQVDGLAATDPSPGFSLVADSASA